MSKFLSAKSAFVLVLLAAAGFLGRPALGNVLEMPDWYSYPIGCIDKTGKIIIEPKYNQIGDFVKGKACALIKKDYIVINKEGKVLNEKCDLPFGGILPRVDKEGISKAELLIIKQNGKYGFTDKTGKIVIKPKFDSVEDFSEGRAAIKQNGKWGFIDKTGKIVAKPKFTWIIGFSEGMAAVRQKNNQWGFIDKSGKLVISPQFDQAKSFYDGVAIVNNNSLIDKKGKVIFTANHGSIKNFKDGFAIAEIIDGNSPKSGYINTFGQWVIKPQFDMAQNFSEGLAAVKINKQWGYIDKTGKIVIKPQFDYADYFYEGIAQIRMAPKPHKSSSKLPTFPLGLVAGISVWAGFCVRKARRK